MVGDQWRFALPRKTTDTTRLERMYNQALMQEAQLENKQNSRHIVPRRLTKTRLQSSSPSGVQGEVAADENSCLWVHIDGEWEEYACSAGMHYTPGVGVGVASTTMAFNGFPNWDSFMVEVYTHPGPPSSEPLTVIGPVDQEQYDDEYINEVYWLNLAHSQLLVRWRDRPEYVDTWRTMNADGSNETNLSPTILTNEWGYDGPFFINNVPHITIMPDIYGGPINTYNLFTGGLFGSIPYFAGSVGYDRMGSQAIISYDGTRSVVLVFNNSYTSFRHYLVDTIGGGNRIALTAPVASTSGPASFGWYPSGEKLFHRTPNSGQIGIVNADAGDYEVVYTVPGGSHINSGCYQLRMSPDGSMLGFMAYDAILNSLIFSAFNTITYEVVVSADFPHFEDNQGWDWSPDSTQAAFSWNDPGKGLYTIDIDSGIWTRFVTYTEDAPLAFEINWGSRRLMGT